MIAPRRFHASGEGPPGISWPRRRRAPGGVGHRFLLGAIVPLFLSIGLAAPTAALGASLVSVSVAFHTIPVATIGSEVIVTASIRRADRVAPTGLRVGLSIDGKFLSSSHADAGGNLAFRVSGAATATAGTFGLRADFTGSRGLAAARASATLKIRPAVVTITTVPVVIGVPIKVGDQTATTGADGTTTVTIKSVGPVFLEADLDHVSDPSIRVSFIRWGDQVYDLKREIVVRGDVSFVLGLRTAYQAAVRFIDQAGAPVDPTTISRARFTSSTGGELVLTDFGSVWWEAGTAVSRTGGLQESSTLWRLSEVEMAGTNTVNQGQQAFSPTIHGTWTISLLLFDLVVKTNDALTGSAMPGTAELVFPDSTSRTAPLGAEGSARFVGLPRGSYVVKLKTDGIAPTTPIALSRSQDATIRVISFLDIGIAGGVILLVLVGLLWIGRRRHMPWLVRVSALPRAVARRLPAGSAAALARRRLPVTTSAITRLPADLATIRDGRGSAALAFGSTLVGNLARLLVKVVAWATRLVVAAGRLIGHAALGARGRSAGTGRGGPAEVRGGPARGSRGSTVEDAPSWPPSTGSSPMPVIHPPVTFRTPSPIPQPLQPGNALTSRANNWFEVTEDEGPTHECRRCHRQVPDSAQFCRSCGHRQE